MKNKEYIKGFEAGAETTAEQSNEINAIAQEGIRKGLIKEIRKTFKEVENPYTPATITPEDFKAVKDILLKATLKIFK